MSSKAKCPANIKYCEVRLALYNIFHDEIAHLATAKGLLNLMKIDSKTDDCPHIDLLEKQLNSLDRRIKRRLHDLQDSI